MSDELPTPPVPDLARAKGQNVRELADWFVDYFNIQGAPFNYRTGTKAVRSAYKGLHRLPLLTAACANEKSPVGRSANTDIVRCAAPFAFNRNTQVFDLSPRRFSFGRDRRAAYRIPFLFVENGIIKAYYLQPRKAAGLDFDELCMVATIMKRHLLDVEFFGQRFDLELVDVGVPRGAVERLPRKYTLADMRLWTDERLTDRLTMISEALDSAASSGLVVKRHRMRARPEPEMPLFD